MQGSIADVARDLRQRAQLFRPAFSTKTLVSVACPSALVTGDELPVGVDEAVSRVDEGFVILYRRGLSGPEQRMAIAHGLAHILFDEGRTRCSDALRERRADRFSEELLVPLDELTKVLEVLPSKIAKEQRLYLDHVDQLASFFNVPSLVIRSRIRTLVTSAH
jgi:Zn-dependent peptidase ImmA (M78 family)